MEAHGDIEVGLSLNGSMLERLGGNGVILQLKEERAEIQLVEKAIKENWRDF